MPEIDVTIVVCTYNRADLLRGALESLAALRTLGRWRYEIVVVDNASTDDTSRVIEAASRRGAVPVRGVREPRKGVSCARNCGIRAARGRWIAFFDDDQIADPCWLLELLGTAERMGVRCVGGAVSLLMSESALVQLPTVCRHLLGESAALTAPRRFSRKLTAMTGNLLIHRTVFDEIGLFDETLREAGEDTDLSRRMQAAGIIGWFVPAAIVQHVVPPYRLEESYFRWTSLRNGMHLAQRECQQLGGVTFALVLAARLAKVVMQHFPGLAWGRLTRSRKHRLSARCQFWRLEGYVRLAFSRMSPHWFAQDRFLSTVDFRAERALFACGPAAAQVREE